MSVSRTLVALTLDQDRLCAVSASVGGGKVRVKAWLSAKATEGVDLRDAAAAGKWIARELEGAGLGKSAAVFVVPRGEVVLKRLRLPRGRDGSAEAELAGMVRLQMARQLTMGIEGTAIDYAPVGWSGQGEKGAGVASAEGAAGIISVVAGALPGDRMAWYRGVARAAGMKIERVGLKAAGAAALVAEASQKRTGPVLAIAVGWGTTEFVVVEEGHLVFARAADVGMGTPPAAGEPDGAGAFVQRLAVEAKRTWMSYRSGQESGAVESVVVLGEGALANEIAQKCGEAVELPWTVAGLPKGVEAPAEMPEVERLAAAPLIGLLAERAIGRPTLDFAHPRKPPDVKGARRRRVLMATLGLVLAGGVAFIVGMLRLDEAGRAVSDAAGRQKQAAEAYEKFVMDHAKYEHIEEWKRARTDWMAHLRYLSDQAPETRQGVLDSFSGSMAAAVKFVPKNAVYSGGTWSHGQAATLLLTGRVKDRDAANSLRGRLIEGGVYDVQSRGADMPDRFTFELSTPSAVPVPPAKKPEPGKAAGGGAGGPAADGGGAKKEESK